MKTVRVRVFVSVGPGAGWLACGGCNYPDAVSKGRTSHCPENGDIGYWIEADLPLPNQAPEIVATVTRAE